MLKFAKVVFYQLMIWKQVLESIGELWVSDEGRLLRVYKSKRPNKEWPGSLSNGYYMVTINEKQKYVHKIVAQYFIPNEDEDFFKVVDHRDRDTGHNDMKNLRRLSQQLNLLNSAAKNYSWSKPLKKWRTQIQLFQKSYHLGYYEDREIAAEIGSTARQMAFIYIKEHKLTSMNEELVRMLKALKR